MFQRCSEEIRVGDFVRGRLNQERANPRSIRESCRRCLSLLAGRLILYTMLHLRSSV